METTIKRNRIMHLLYLNKVISFEYKGKNIYVLA